MIPKYVRHLCGLFVAVFLTGCDENTVDIHPVKLTLLYKGKPATGAEAVFHPKSEQLKELKLYPNGRAGTDGRVELTTFEPADGAPAGEYRITVVWTNSKDPDDGEEATEVAPDRLGGRYGNPDRTPLSITVSVDGANEQQIDLGKSE